MHILVAIDGSAASRGAVRFASRLTQALAGWLTLLHVVSPSGDREEAEALLRSAQADAEESGTRGTARLEVGDPVEVIVTVRGEIGADMLVVGTHGRKGWTRVLLGSVAESLYKSAPWPVAVVRSFDPPSAGIGPLLAPTDFSEGATRAVEAAAFLARKLGVRLGLLHVLPEAVPPKGERGRAASRRAADELRRDAETRLRALVKTLVLDPQQVDVSLVTGVDAAEIAHFAKEIRAGCIVMGTRGLTGLPRVILGSVADQILRQAPCPVLFVAPGIAPGGGWRRETLKTDEGVHG
ncbi:MAG: universal stress protein [Candidatus Methylomirabilales bacterium]